MPYVSAADAKRLIAQLPAGVPADDDWIDDETGEVYLEMGHDPVRSWMHPDHGKAEREAEERAAQEKAARASNPETPPDELTKMLWDAWAKDDDLSVAILSNPGVRWEDVQECGDENTVYRDYLVAIVRNIGYALWRWAGSVPMAFGGSVVSTPSESAVKNCTPEQQLYLAEILLASEPNPQMFDRALGCVVTAHEAGFDVGDACFQAAKMMCDPTGACDGNLVSDVRHKTPPGVASLVADGLTAYANQNFTGDREWVGDDIRAVARYLREPKSKALAPPG